jgi:hypothetical protein
MLRYLLIFFLFIQLYLRSEVIDSFENLSGWSLPQISSNAFASIENVEGYKNKCLKFSVDFNDGFWAQTYKEFKYYDLSEGDILKFYYKYDGDPVNLYFNLNNNEKLVLGLNPTSVWLPCTIDLKQFSNIDLSKIELMKFVIFGSAGFKGSLTIDQLQLLRLFPVSSSNLLIDNYEDNEDYNTLLSGVVQYNFLYPTGTNDYILKSTNSSENFLILRYVKGTKGKEVKWIIKFLGTAYTNFSQFDNIKFKIKSNSPDVKIGVSLQYSGYIYNLNSSTHNFYNNWQTIKIPVKYFIDRDLKSVGEIQFIFLLKNFIENDLNSFEIYIDDLELEREFKPEGVVKTVENFEYFNSSSWVKFGHNNNKIEVSSVDGIDGKSFKIDFNFIDGDFLLIERYFYLNLRNKILKFKFKSEGEINNLEVKVSDKKDWQNVSVTYIRKFYNIVGTTCDWIELKIEPDDWQYFSSDNDKIRKSLNLGQIEKIWLTISQSGNSQKSSFYIDELELTEKLESNYILKNGKIIESFKIENIYFSPNNDGFNDRVKFLFNLKEDCKISLYIFNLKGELVKSIFNYGEPFNFNKGEHFIEWDGRDDNNKILDNGIYTFKFIAESSAIREEVKKIIIISK